MVHDCNVIGIFLNTSDQQPQEPQGGTIGVPIILLLLCNLTMKFKQQAHYLFFLSTSILWLATTNAFVSLAKPPRLGPFRRTPPRREMPFIGSPSPRIQLGDSNQPDDEEELPLARFFKALYQGLTLPFPTLRQLALDTPTGPSSTDKGKKGTTRIGFSFREAIAAIVLYLTLGAVSYHSTVLREAPFSWVDALYFSVVTFTSVGYGDLCPTSSLGKVFTILFGMSGISILGIAIATIGSRLAAVENDMIQTARKASRKRVLGFMHSLGDIHPFRKNAKENDNQSNDNKAAPGRSSAEMTTSASSKEDDESPSKTTGVPLWRQTFKSLLKKSVPAFSVIILGGIAMGRLEGWSLLDSCYFAFVTAVTLGYGDFSPVTQPGRLWAIVFIPLAVAAAGEVLGNVATTLQERRQEQYYESLVEQELNVERLLAMDTNHNGKVSREEYVQFSEYR